MPANLTADYKKAEQVYKGARTDEERLKALELMLSTIPKHKGTDKLQADIKRRISKIKKEGSKKKGGGRQSSFEYHIEKQGAAQVTLTGLGNSGKSSIVDTVSNAEVIIGEYPASTIKPVPAMMPFEDIQVQLVDAPPVDFEATQKWVANILRYTDMIALVLDLADEPVLQYQLIEEQLLEWRIKLLKSGDEAPEISGEWYKPAIIIGSKTDLPDTDEYLDEVRKTIGDDFPITYCSAKTEQDIDTMKRDIFKSLKMVRIYSKTPGKEADKSSPFILPVGSNLLDFAERVHKDFKQRLDYARIWGTQVFDGQRAPRDYILQDQDIIELHN